MQLTKEHFLKNSRFSIAYHPDGDGFGVINVLLNHIPHAEVRLYSVDNSQRDFTAEQYKQLEIEMEQGFWVVYLDLTPSNIKQLQDITEKTQLLYLDHHQISPLFLDLLQEKEVPANNPRLDIPERAEKYAAGLQMYQLWNSDSKQAEDIPYLFVSLFGDAKFEYWEKFHSEALIFQPELSKMADALSIVGLTKPLGHYNPVRTDELFEEAIQLCREGFRQSGNQGLLDAFYQTKIKKAHTSLVAKIEAHCSFVFQQIEQRQSIIQVEDTDYWLVAILLKEAYKSLPFQNYHVLYQVDPVTEIVHYAVMSKGVEYDCAKIIRESPFVTGGGHTDRAGCTGALHQLNEALDFFRSKAI